MAELGKLTYPSIETDKTGIMVDGDSVVVTLSNAGSYVNKLTTDYLDIHTFSTDETSFTWTPTAKSLSQYFMDNPTKKTISVWLHLKTYDGSRVVNVFDKAINVTLSQKTGAPIIIQSSTKITDSNEITNEMGVIVVGKSQISITGSMTPQFGASIADKRYLCLPKKSSVKTYESIDKAIQALANQLESTDPAVSGTIGMYVIDSRGLMNSIHSDCLIANYNPPNIDHIEVHRCDSEGNNSSSGTYAKIEIDCRWSPIAIKKDSVLTPKNPCTIEIGYRTLEHGYTYEPVNSEDISASGIVSLSKVFSSTTFDLNTVYYFAVNIVDSFGSTIQTGITFTNENDILYISSDGNTIELSNDFKNSISVLPTGVSLSSYRDDDNDGYVDYVNTFTIYSNDRTRSDGMELSVGSSPDDSHSIEYSRIYLSSYKGSTSIYIKSNNIYINNKLLADYIIERGKTNTSDTYGNSWYWTYVKYASGFAMLWGQCGMTPQPLSQYGSMYYATANCKYPFEFSEWNAQATVTSPQGGLHSINITSDTSSGTSFYIWNAANEVKLVYPKIAVTGYIKN